jgi:hypothetical protein
MENQEVNLLIDQIVQSHFFDELEVYDLDKSELLQNAWDNNFSTASYNSAGGINQAGPALEEILNCISTIIATVKTVLEIRNMRNKKKGALEDKDITIDLVSGKWAAELQLAGMSEEKAKALTHEFSIDLNRILRHDK